MRVMDHQAKAACTAGARALQPPRPDPREAAGGIRGDAKSADAAQQGSCSALVEARLTAWPRMPRIPCTVINEAVKRAPPRPKSE